jgi:phage terminase large subunit-like protein
VLPKGIKTSGFPAVEATCRFLGLEFDPWQRDLNRCILAKTKAGLYAADMVVISIPRQVGKTWDIGALVFADSIIHPGTTTIWTAHRFKVARETFDSLRAVALSAPLAPHIDPDQITTAAGNESIRFRNGSRIVFAARERGAIRGFTKVRRLILDEAQILNEHALADLVPTMNQAENPQIILMGTPPKPTDPGEAFTRLRTEALTGESEGVLYVEFAADEFADSDDRKQWAKANASYPKRTNTKAVQRMRKALSDEDFRREGLGIWDGVGREHPPELAALRDRRTPSRPDRAGDSRRPRPGLAVRGSRLGRPESPTWGRCSAFGWTRARPTPSPRSRASSTRRPSP